jgi:hypothetical protein
MSKMNRFFAKVGRGFKKVGKKVENTYEGAADSMHAKGLEIRIDEQYENLGRIVYRDLHTEEDLEESKLEIIAKIDALFDELEQIKAAKAARKAKAEEPACECEECAEECAEECEAPAEEKKSEEV